MLYYLQELLAATNANARRRRFNRINAVVIVLISIVLMSIKAPVLLILAIMCFDLVVHVGLVIIWARRDALEAYRQSQ